MHIRSLKKNETLTYCFFGLISILMILLFNHDSPVYHYNQWVDTNYYFTVARGMLHGRTMYSGIFDQKGPIVYFVHCLALMIAPTKYWGMLPLLISLFFLNLVIVYRWSCLYIKQIPSVFVTIVFTFLFFNFTYYQRGDSAEELVMPFLLYGFYLFFSYTQANRLPNWLQNTIMGFGIGWILLTKFSLLLAPATLFVVLWVFLLCTKRFKKFGTSILFSGLGFLVCTIPVLLYFIFKHALNALLHYYFYLNLFLYTPDQLKYSSNASKWIGVWFAKSSTWFTEFWLTMLIIIISIIGLLFSNRLLSKRKALPFLLLVILALYLSASVPALAEYYFLALMPLTVPALILIGDVLQNSSINKLTVSAMIAMLSMLPIATSIFNSSVGNESRFVRKDNQPSAYSLMAPMIHSKVGRHSLLVYKAYDGGFYNVTDTVPSQKYFAKYNIPDKSMPSIFRSMEKSVKAGKTKFVVADGYYLAEVRRLNSNYRIVSTYNLSNELWERYTLLELK